MKPTFLTRTLLLLVLALIASTTAQGTDDRAPFTLSPDTAKAEQAFNLKLLSYRFNCGTTYSHQSVQVEGKKVTLTFQPTAHPEAICPAVYMPYGPTFSIAPLVAGYYDVYARTLLACMTDSTPKCPTAVPAEEFAGVLSVGITTRRGWFLDPKQAPAQKDFTLRLLNDAYGNCQTSFSHEMLEVRDGAFYASFVIEQHPERVCVTDIRPYGPSFEVKGQVAGRYPVYANTQNPCRFDTTHPCLTASSPDFFFLVDTLVVGGTTETRQHSERRVPEAVFPSGTIKGYRPDGRSNIIISY